MLSDRFAKINFFKVAFFLLPLIYASLYAPYGMADTDQGFIPGLAWRVLSGQTIYEDFVYVRPPLSPYFHAFWLAVLPDNLEMIGIRVLFYLFMALSSLFTVLAVRKFVNLEYPWFFAALGFVLSVHNYPPQAWHTVDGIFFSAFGFFLLSFSFEGKSRLRRWANPMILPGMFFLVLAAMAKQPFYLAPVFGFIFSLVFNRARAVLPLLFFIGGIMALILTLDPDWLDSAIAWTNVSTNFEDLLVAGLDRYAKPFLVWVLPVWVAGMLCPFIGRKIPAANKVFSFLFWSAIIAALFLNVYTAYEEQEFIAPQFGWERGIFLLALVYIRPGIFRLDPFAWLMASLLAVAWASGISWGYATPVLFLTPALIGTELSIKQKFQYSSPIFRIGLLISAIISFFLLYQYPYRDAPRSQLTYHLGDVFPKMKFIYTGKDNFEKAVELRELINAFGDNFTVMPAYPHAHFISEKPPVYLSDWVHNAEVGFEVYGKTLIEKLEDEKPTVFFEKDKLSEILEKGHYGTEIAKHVYINWTKTKSGKYFDVFQKP